MFLKVRVLNGSQILAADFGSKPSSDPYVEVSHSGNSKKTNYIDNTLTPVWNEDLILPIESTKEPVVFKVFDSDWSGDDSLGVVQYYLRDLKPGNQIFRMLKLYGGEHGGNICAALKSYTSSAKEGAVENVAGSITSSATGSESAGSWISSFVHAAQNLGETDNFENQDEAANIALGMNSTNAGLLGAVDDNFGVITVGMALFETEEEAESYQFLPPPVNGQLSVRVIGGRNLIAADLSARACSDPYCSLAIGEQQKETKACKNTVHPDWHQIFYFDNVQQNDRLIVTAYDHDISLGTDDSLGESVINLSQLNLGEEVFCLLRLVGGSTGENVEAVLASQLEPLSANIASYTVENAIGGTSGHVAGQIFQMFPESAAEENPNHGTIGIGLTLNSPLGDGTASVPKRADPSAALSYFTGQLCDFAHIGLPPH